MLKIGVIGYGSRINIIVQKLLASGKVELCAVMDTDCEKCKSRYLSDEKFGGIHYYGDAEEMLKAEPLDGVLIGTRCSTHADYAVLVAKYKIPLFLEKPVGICEEDIEKLESISEMSDITVVSFPLRMSRLVTYVKELIDADQIGKVEFVQAYNDVPYARGYYRNWYRDDAETGGLFLQKATHDLDYINFLLGDNKPIRVCAMKSKQIFKGDKPAGLKCKDCDERETCPESPENVRKTGDVHGIGEGYCCFAVDTGNEDSGSCLIEYESGMHIAYSQDFIARNKAERRGARLVGYKGSVEFDFYTNKIVLYKHTENMLQTYDFSGNKGSHFGGDDNLAINFIGVMSGKEKSKATLNDGILSAKMCLMCKRSAEQKKFFDI